MQSDSAEAPIPARSGERGSRWTAGGYRWTYEIDLFLPCTLPFRRTRSFPLFLDLTFLDPTAGYRTRWHLDDPIDVFRVFLDEEC